MIEKAQMRKRNMKLFPIYKTLSWDYIFFYTTNFLFLTQCKHIHPALFNLITAELLSSLAFGIKESVDPSLLNESIPPSRYKSKIFAKISQKGVEL